jgi:hypothetical protein
MVAALALVGSTAVFAQNPGNGNDNGKGNGPAEDGIWRIKGDDGETVKVLPTPASAKAHENHGDGEEIPMAINGYSVFGSSYGSNPGSLQNHGGYVISNASFFAVYYNSSSAATLQSGINSFVNNFSNSDPGMKVVTQYSANGYTVSASLGNAGSFVDSKTTPNRISDSQIRSYLAGLFSAGRVAFVPNTRIYGVYLPNGTTSTNGTARSCTNYCGYHSSFSYNGQTAIYAVFPYNNCSGCSLSGRTVLDMETIVTSHEIREAITDPVNAWWEASSGYEADDKCAWHNLYQQSGGAWVQPEYSNALAGWPRGCVTP